MALARVKVKAASTEPGWNVICISIIPMKILKKFLVLLLSIQIVFSPLITAHSQEMNSAPDVAEHFDSLSEAEKRLAEQAFFDDVNNRLRFFIEANLAKINTYIFCQKKISANVLADEFGLKNECQKQIDIVYNNIQIQYPKVRRFQFLLNAFSSSTLLWSVLSHSVLNGHSDFEAQMRSIVLAKTKNPKADRTDYFKISHSSPLDSVLGESLSDVEVPNSEWTDQESQAFLNDDSVSKLQGYNSFFEKVCKENVVKHPDICSKIKLNYTSGRGFYFIFPSHEPNIAKGIDEMWTMQQMVPQWTAAGTVEASQVIFKAQNTVRKLVDEIFEPHFFEIAQTNAYVALVTSANPGHEELLNAFLIMKKQAKAALKDYEKLDARLNETEPSRDDQLSLLGYQPVVDAVIKRPLPEGYLKKFGSEKLSRYNEDEVTQIYKHLDKEYQQMMMYQFGEEVAILLAMNVGLCWVGPAKFLKLYKFFKSALMISKTRKLFTPLCYSFNFATNWWFIDHAVDDYAQIYQEIFTAVNDQAYIRELSALRSAERGILFSIVFVFAGTKDLRRGSKDLLKGTKPLLGLLAQKLPKLTASSREILAQAIARIWSRGV